MLLALAQLFVLWTSCAVEHNLLNVKQKPTFIKAPPLLYCINIFSINRLIGGVVLRCLVTSERPSKTRRYSVHNYKNTSEYVPLIN